MNHLLKSIINDTNNVKTLFVFDFDGVMIEARYSGNSICRHDFSSAGITNVVMSEDVYAKGNALEPTICLIDNIRSKPEHDICCIKVLSVVQSTIEYNQKLNFLKQRYNIANTEDFIGVQSKDVKAVILNKWRDNYDRVVYIDDSLADAIYIEKNTIEDVFVFHYSSIVTQ